MTDGKMSVDYFDDNKRSIKFSSSALAYNYLARVSLVPARDTHSDMFLMMTVFVDRRGSARSRALNH